MHLPTLTLRGACLAEPGRLRILALLARRAHYAEELAEATGLHPATISHHLRRLSEAGLIEVERRSPYRLVHLHQENWDEFREQLGRLSEWSQAFALPDEQRISGRLLQRYLDRDGKVARLPRQSRPLDVVLRHLLDGLDADRLHPRRQLLAHLLGRCQDAEAVLQAAQRRGWLVASGEVYRRVVRSEQP